MLYGEIQGEVCEIHVTANGQTGGYDAKLTMSIPGDLSITEFKEYKFAAKHLTDLLDAIRFSLGNKLGWEDMRQKSYYHLNAVELYKRMNTFLRKKIH